MALVPALVYALGAPPALAAAPLSPESQGQIRAATFEVVLKKPTQDSLSYEKELPLDLIPYQERTDEYLSVGTAFAIDGARYVSAAHVFAAGLHTQFGTPALRDGAGKVHEINQIVKYSGHEDFVVFTLKVPPTTPTFQINRKPTINETVYAVGNAHGEGVVIRDGLYTSDTPEQENGRWKWLRFSAAASPGNSGGPLLDSTGKVVGVVLRKSQSENLNYALRIEQVLDAPDNLAVLDSKMRYFLPNTRITESQNLKWDFKLPLGFVEFDRTLTGKLDAYSDDMLQDLLTKNRDKIFPRGEGSQQLLHGVYTTAFPYLIAEQADRKWDAFYPQQTANAELKKNGFVTHGVLGGYTMVRIRRPDDVGAKALFADSKLYADWILQAIAINRSVGPEEVRITSFGKAKQEYTHADSYGRQWQVRLWPIEYNDTVAISFALPTPEGYIGLLRTASLGMSHGIQSEMKALTDFIYVSYAGTLAQWREYIEANGEYLPAAFKGIDIDFAYDKHFRYKSKRVSVEYTPELQKITPQSYLTLSFAFFNEKDSTVWDVGAVSLLENQHNETMLLVQRRLRPNESLPDSLKSDWDKLAGARYPYDSTPIVDKGTTVVNALYGAPDSTSEVVYAVSYVAEGEQSKEKMNATLGTLMKGVKVSE
jgi:hypothetical protein